MSRRLRVIQTADGNVTVGSGEWNSDGDDDDAGSEISLLLMTDKGIHAEGLLLYLDWPSVVVPATIFSVTGTTTLGQSK